MQFVFIALFIFFKQYVSSGEYLEAYIYSWLLFDFIVGFVFLQKKIIFYDPMVLYSLYNLFTVFDIWYLIGTEMNTSLFIYTTTFYTSPFAAFGKAAKYYFIAYCFLIVGYTIFSSTTTTNAGKINYEIKTKKNSMYDLSIFLLLLAGCLNFYYNNFILGTSFFKNIGNLSRNLELIEKQSTTVGYFFAIVALVLYISTKNILKNSLFYIMFVLVFLFKLSTGRIFGSLILLVCLLYFKDMYYRTNNGNSIGFFKFFLIAVMGIVIYFFRAYLGVMQEYSSFFSFISKNLSILLYFIFDKGNVPNVPLFMKIIDSWEYDIGFQYGKTFLAPIVGLFSNFRLCSKEALLDFMPAVMAKNMWYLHVPSGNLPVTGVGECYLNFGIFGITVLMFVFGVIIAKINNFLLICKNRHISYMIIYFFISFWVLYPKGEINNIDLLLPLFYFFVVVIIESVSYGVVKIIQSYSNCKIYSSSI